MNTKKEKVILIDNYDSFSYNLYQYVGELAGEVLVVKNDEYTCAQLAAMKPTHIVLSPGPCRPKEAGITEEVPLYFKGKVPVLGVCLGHQGICEAFGGRVTYAKKLWHGKADEVTLDNECKLFYDLPKVIRAARYHSLAAADLPDCLQVTALAPDGEIMGVRHKGAEIYGVQFHPESIMTEYGKEILKNFLNIA